MSLNHHPECSDYVDGHCLCECFGDEGVHRLPVSAGGGLEVERSPLAPSEGTWAVFAEKVVKERDEARDEIAKARAALRDGADDSLWRLGETAVEALVRENAELREALRWYVFQDNTWEGGEWEERNALSLAGKRRAMRLLGMKVDE
jgi:hypothetical protein